MKATKFIQNTIMVLSILLGMTLSTTLVSCQDDDITGKVTPPSDVNLMELDMWSYSLPFEVKSNSKWRVETTGDFCYAIPAEGEGDAVIKLCIIDNDTEERQQGELRIIFPGDESKNATIQLRQKWEGDYDDNAVTIGEGNRKYAVGYGFDATGGYACNDALKKPIVRFEDMVDQEMIVFEDGTKNYNCRTYTGSSVTEISNDLAVSAGLDGKYCGFKGEISSAFNWQSFSSNNNEYALTYYDMDVRKYYIEANLEDIVKDYMTPAAYKAINGTSKAYESTSAGMKKLIQDYGTHMVQTAVVGGRIRHSMTVDISKVSDIYEIGAFAAASYAGTFVNAQGSVDEKYKASYQSNKSACNIKLSVLGGTTAAANALSGGLTEKNLSTWKGTIEKNPSFVSLGSDRNALIPLYELVDSKFEDRKKALKAYMESNQFLVDFSPISDAYNCGTVAKVTVPKFAAGSSLIKGVSLGGQIVAQICEEFIPTINKEARVRVMYPVIENKARYNLGYFIGNATHKPARVSWKDDGTVTVMEDSQGEYKEGTAAYIKGSNIMFSYVENKDVKAATVKDAVLNASYETRTGSYPLVRIFNRVWLRSNFKGTKTRDGRGCWYSAIPNRTHYGYAQAQAADGGIAPAGWQVPHSNDYQHIFNRLVANGISNVAQTFAPGGVLGYDLTYGYLGGTVSYGYTDTWTRNNPKAVFIRPDNGSYSIGDFGDKEHTGWRFLPIRFIKDAN